MMINLLKKIGMIAGKAAPDILTAINPAMGALLQTLLNAVVQAESQSGPGNGPRKKQEVLSALQVAAPLLLKVVEGATGKDLADDEKFASGIDKMVDGLVDLLNAFRVFPKA